MSSSLSRASPNSWLSRDNSDDLRPRAVVVDVSSSACGSMSACTSSTSSSSSSSSSSASPSSLFDSLDAEADDERRDEAAEIVLLFALAAADVAAVDRFERVDATDAVSASDVSTSAKDDASDAFAEATIREHTSSDQRNGWCTHNDHLREDRVDFACSSDSSASIDDRSSSSSPSLTAETTDTLDDVS